MNDVQLAALVAAGTITPATLVWHEGMTDWRTYGQVAPAPAAGAAVEPPPLTVVAGDVAVCVECRGTFPRSEMVAYAGEHVCAGCRDAFFQKVREGVVIPATIGGRYVLASFGLRWLAKIIDGVLLTVLQSIVTLPLLFGMIPIMDHTGPESGAVVIGFLALQLFTMLLQFGVAIGFKTFFYGRFGATPGKMALSLKVVRPDGSKLSYKRSCGRAAAEILNGFTFYIGYLMAAFDEERRGLHDRLCDTRVIRVN